MKLFKINIGIQTLIGAIVFTAVLPSVNLNARACWKETYGRGVGKIPTLCGQGQVKSGLLCYPKQDGYTVVAGVAWQNCPTDFKDTGGHCLKPAAYGRGAGYPWKFGDPAFNYDKALERCNNDNKPAGCEMDGLIAYPKCKPGYHKVGCCICSPNCPAGMTDIGVSCQKKSHIVETILPQCAQGQDYDAGLCYPPCKGGSKGVGPVCWGECREGMTDCGALCASSKEECGKVITQQILSIVQVGVKVVAGIASGGTSLAAGLVQGVAEVDFEKIEREKLQKKELTDFAKKVRDDVIDQFGIGMSEKEFKERVKKQLEDVAGMDSFMKEKLADIAASPNQTTTNALVDTIAKYDFSGLGIGKVMEAFNLEICKQ